MASTELSSKTNVEMWTRKRCKAAARYVLDGGGDVQTSRAWGGKLARVDVGNFPDSGVDVLQVLSLHHQDGLGRVEVELQGGHER